MGKLRVILKLCVFLHADSDVGFLSNAHEEYSPCGETIKSFLYKCTQL